MGSRFKYFCLFFCHIAHTCGYYDQLHFKDFKEFAGALPSTLAKQIINAPAQLQEHMRI